MLKRLNQLEKQHGGAIPFSALKDKKIKTKRKYATFGCMMKKRSTS